MSSVAIIIINYNSTPLTKKCVQSLLAQKEKSDDYHIIILDNASKQPIQEDAIKDVDIIHSQKNLGFAEGNNVAVKYALKKYSPDYLMLLNNDTRVGKGMVNALIRAFQANTEAGIIVPKIYFERNHEYYSKDYSEHQRGRVLWYAGGGIDWGNMILTHKGIDEVDRGQFDIDLTSGTKRGDEDFATGCCMLTTPEIWKRLRGFDKNYFLYYEDADLSVRLIKNLKKHIFLEPKAVLYHQNAGSSQGSGSAIHQYYQTRNRLRFGLQYASNRTKLSLLLEARRLFLSGNQAVKLGILHSLGGKWGNQTAKIPVEKA